MTITSIARMEPIANLRELQLKVHRQADTSFSGIGVIVWDGVTTIPVTPMRIERPTWIGRMATSDIFIKVSKNANPFHDGFHIVDTDFNLVQMAAYFSPPISEKVPAPAIEKSFGGRYFAAAFGSCLEGVICTGVASRNYGPIIFKNGREV